MGTPALEACAECAARQKLERLIEAQKGALLTLRKSLDRKEAELEQLRKKLG